MAKNMFFSAVGSDFSTKLGVIKHLTRGVDRGHVHEVVGVLVYYSA